MPGLDGEQIVIRTRALAADHATRHDLSADASDDELDAVIDAVGALVARDRKLRRPLRDPAVRAIVDTLVAWEVVVAAVGRDVAEARWVALRGGERSTVAPSDTTPAAPAPSPAAPAAASRSVRGRPRRLPDVQVHPGLAESVHPAATDDDDPLHGDGYEHHLWLEEWMELAVGAEAFEGLETAVAAHPLVDVAMHMDREVLYVAAPALHPTDVAQIVLAVLADAYDPEWEQQV